ncbi:MAG: hypothetical protein HY934_00410 [Candidatus Firestonebacteria bacterium]|nr:hypothetical protein [Candidatus Firestonebacteria bacterium]
MIYINIIFFIILIILVPFLPYFIINNEIAKKIYLMIFSVYLIIASSSFIRFTPTIEGIVVDATTMEPIEKAVIDVEWNEAEPVLMTTENYNSILAQKIIITDKNGKYKIPFKILIRSIAIFIGIPIIKNGPAQFIAVRHPLYVFKDAGAELFEKNIFKIKYDIKLISLEERLKIAKEKRVKGEKDDFSISRTLEEMQGVNINEYINLKNKYNLKYDWDFIWRKWNELCKLEIGKSLEEFLNTPYKLHYIDKDLYNDFLQKIELLKK